MYTLFIDQSNIATTLSDWSLLKNIFYENVEAVNILQHKFSTTGSDLPPSYWWWIWFNHDVLQALNSVRFSF